MLFRSFFYPLKGFSGALSKYDSTMDSSMDRLRLDSIIEAASSALTEGGYECIEAEWESNDRILRLFIDCVRAEATGMTMEECVKASRLLDATDRLDQVIAGSYTLEVSSPGVERPLRRQRDFEKHLGQMIEVKLSDKIQDRKHGKGRLVDVLDETGDDVLITLDTNRGPWQFPLATLQRASLVYDWGNS